ncbi:hypothetical protein K3888_11175 [Dietzia aurantiaca]|uniref:hypothetical protein n=1 Tax=Dietzia aurantiaca TaxID=983873 RepID=UPI001E5EB065|nr:hypothetical protein [Dietzia aurantiaca]MCD2263259.1 hypothetical protein [Dietzia aurantiaca]
MARVVANAPTDYRAAAIDAIDSLVEAGDPFTVEDIAARIPSELPPAHPNLLPALIGARARNGLIVPMGRYRTTRRSRHSSKNTVWRASA